VALELLRQKTGPEAETSLERIRREGDRLNAMIGELLSLNALESTNDPTKRETVNLDTLVQEIAEDADFEARSRNRRVIILSTEMIKILGVPQMLARAIENVIRNAVRYTAEGTEVEIKLNCTHDGSKAVAVVSVRDYGPGVPDAELEKIFRPFYRVADARDRQSGGTGIGLAITERAVRLHSGEVKAANHPAGGLEVKIYLPIDPVSC
jgi:two-component system sensor histidine kinase CpxA